MKRRRKDSSLGSPYYGFHTMKPYKLYMSFDDIRRKINCQVETFCVLYGSLRGT
jgi:hypothetical protein